MGVKDLWSILEPVKTSKPLDDLNGTTVAVDLGFWACQMNAALADCNAVNKPYLRNLFFRTLALLRRNIHPIFVTEGPAPDLKQETIRNRLNQRTDISQQNKKSTDDKQIQQKHTRPVQRSKFNACLKECCRLIELLGLPVLESDGEAEALCAALNAAGFVEAVITDDGDAFLYGAHRIYRNFNLEGKTPSLDCYDAIDVEIALNLDREKLVALALLIGCDYCPKGVPGVGKDCAMKFFKEFDSKNDNVHHLNGDKNILDAMRRWNLGESRIQISKYEAAIRSKALKLNDFPDERIINEFLRPRLVVDTKNSLDSWQKPNFVYLYHFLIEKIDWDSKYTLEKLIPVVSLWILREKSATKIVTTNSTVISATTDMEIVEIIKQRIRDGQQCFEVKWSKLDEDTFTEGSFYVTVECGELIKQAYPELIQNFEREKEEMSKKRRQKPKKKEKFVVSNRENLKIDQLTTEFHGKFVLDDRKLKEIDDLIENNDNDVIVGRSNDVIVSQSNDVISSQSENVISDKSRDVINCQLNDVTVCKSNDVTISQSNDVIDDKSRDVIDKKVTNVEKMSVENSRKFQPFTAVRDFNVGHVISTTTIASDSTVDVENSPLPLYKRIQTLKTDFKPSSLLNK